jgi:hypothetical protein
MSTQTLVTKSIVGSLLLVGSAITQVSHAEDGKVYPAIACQPALVGTPSTLAYQGDKITNTSAAHSVVVACPIIKDDVFSAAGTNEGYVRFRKFSEVGFLGDLHSFSAFGTGHHVQYKSDFTAAGYKTMSFTALPSFSQGYSVMMLVLPPQAQVFSYRVDEN